MSLFNNTVTYDWSNSINNGSKITTTEGNIEFSQDSSYSEYHVKQDEYYLKENGSKKSEEPSFTHVFTAQVHSETNEVQLDQGVVLGAQEVREFIAFLNKTMEL